MKKYIFMGGNVNHPCRGKVCIIGWKFETSDYVMVYFQNGADPRGHLGFEICHPDNLKEIK